MFTKDPKRIIEDIYDYIGETSSEYVETYEKVWSDFKSEPTLETQAIWNCCELLIDNYQPKDCCKNVIDVGCGFGYIINQILSREKVAVDVSLSQLRKVNSECFKVRTFAEDIPVESSYFSIVICTDVFEHVENAKELSSELYRILKPGGMLLFACPWEQDISIYESKEYKEKFQKYNFTPHLRSIDRQTIKTHFNDFKIISSTMITVAMKSMILKPYSIKFIQFLKEAQ
jgi:2-polyprenyl-3-methyl-5-hydroxy-6-metoxy-1,4-benzoquinol methylase